MTSLLKHISYANYQKAIHNRSFENHLLALILSLVQRVMNELYALTEKLSSPCIPVNGQVAKYKWFLSQSFMSLGQCHKDEKVDMKKKPMFNTTQLI